MTGSTNFIDRLGKTINPDSSSDPRNRYYNPAVFNSFSGTNVLAVMKNRVITEVQAITYSIKREIAPVFVMGDENPRSFSSGKRGIAGSIVTVVFDRESLLSELVGEFGSSNNVRARIFGNINQFGFKMLQNSAGFEDIEGLTGDSTLFQTENLSNYASATAAAISRYGGVDLANATLNTALEASGGNLQDLFTRTDGFGVGGILYADQIPPFNITLSMLNESGRGAQLDIVGVKIMNEGQGFSIDDITNEKAYSFVAREVIPLRPREFISSSLLTGTV